MKKLDQHLNVFDADGKELEKLFIGEKEGVSDDSINKMSGKRRLSKPYSKNKQKKGRFINQ